MTPGARLAAAIELGALSETGHVAPETCFRRYFQKRRYAGGSDRRAIIARIIDATRCRARLDWWLARAALMPDWRHRVLAHVVLGDGTDAETAAALFATEPHGPGPLDPAERAFAEQAAGRHLDDPDMPPAVRGECPDWLFDRLANAWGGSIAAELEALNQPAPVDLRANVARIDRAVLLRELTDDGLPAAITPYSPWGLRLPTGTRVAGASALAAGLAELQDEGSQIIAALCGARPGMTVIDQCAGAGGKTLALGAAMANGGRVDGRLVAADADGRRLAAMTDRVARAGLQGVEVRPQGADGLADLAAQADRVLIDAPCSGSGTWRRRPDLKWRLRHEDLTRLTAEQDGILDAGARLVRPGGWLVYATCSILADENEARIARFLDRQPGFSMVPAAQAWSASVAAPPPSAAPDWNLTPARTGTDGFYCAVLGRRD